MTLIDFVFPKLRTPKTWWDKCLKSPVSEDPSRSNMINVLKHCWNLHQCIFILLIDHWNFSFVGKSLLYWPDKSWDSLLTHCQPMKSILFLRDNLTIPIQKQLSQKEKSFSEFLRAFLKSRLTFIYFDKKMMLTDFVFPKLQSPKSWLDKCLKSSVSEDPSTSNT